MIDISDLVADMEYPGRFLIAEHTTSHCTLIYGVTARSAASKAKQYVLDESGSRIYVVATDSGVMAQGDLTLLDYTAVRLSSECIVIGNGQQVDTVAFKKTASETLVQSLSQTSYEHDTYSTPRITGCAQLIDGHIDVAVHRIYNDGNGQPTREVFDISAGGTYFVSTYAGPNVRPTPSFIEAPKLLETLDVNLEHAVQSVYAAFAPKEGKEDLRVSMVGVRISADGTTEKHIINAL
jgi:IMP cyclohydrolase